MLLPVTCFNAGVLNRVPTVDHHAIAHIDAHMGGVGGVIGVLKEDEVAGSRRRGRDGRADVKVKGIGASASIIPALTAVVDDPGHKAGAVKAGAGASSTPDVRIAQVLLRLPDHGGKLLIRQLLSRGKIKTCRGRMTSASVYVVIPNLDNQYSLVNIQNLVQDIKL